MDDITSPWSYRSVVSTHYGNRPRNQHAILYSLQIPFPPWVYPTSCPNYTNAAYRRASMRAPLAVAVEGRTAAPALPVGLVDVEAVGEAVGDPVVTVAFGAAVESEALYLPTM